MPSLSVPLYELLPSESVNSPDSRPSEDEIDETKAPRSKQRLGVVCTSLLEDGRRVERNDVDCSRLAFKVLFSKLGTHTSAHLLRKHDRARGNCRASQSRCSKELDEASDIVAVFADEMRLCAKLRMDVVEISRCLQFVVTKLLQGAERILVAAFLNVPSWRFCIHQSQHQKMIKGQ